MYFCSVPARESAPNARASSSSSVRAVERRRNRINGIRGTSKILARQNRASPALSERLIFHRLGYWLDTPQQEDITHNPQKKNHGAGCESRREGMCLGDDGTRDDGRGNRGDLPAEIQKPADSTHALPWRDQRGHRPRYRRGRG